MVMHDSDPFMTALSHFTCFGVSFMVLRYPTHPHDYCTLDYNIQQQTGRRV